MTNTAHDVGSAGRDRPAAIKGRKIEARLNAPNLSRVTDAEMRAALRVLLASGQLRTEYEVPGTYDLLVMRMLEAAAKIRKSVMKIAETQGP